MDLNTDRKTKITKDINETRRETNKEMRRFTRQLQVFSVLMLILGMLFAYKWANQIRWDLVVPLIK